MTMTTTCTTTDTIYISPYEIRRPRGRPKKTESECVPKVQIPKPKPPALRGVGRPKREVPLTPDELRERRRKYKKIVNEIQKEYENFYQHCYSRRPDPSNVILYGFHMILYCVPWIFYCVPVIFLRADINCN